MEAVVLRAFGAPENLRLESLPDPSPLAGEVLIRTEACGVCYHDLIMRRGRLPGTSVPAVLGHEVVGEVIGHGAGVTSYAIGDRVATLQRMSCGDCSHCRADRPSLCKVDRRFFGEEIQGGYGQLMTAPLRGICRVPDGLSIEDAAIACCTTGTAVHVCRTRGRIGVGDTVLITGASGGVGLQAVQLCKLDGATVIAVTSSASKRDALYVAGADHVIVSPDLQFANAVRKITGGEGVTVVIEIVGARTFAQSLRCLAPAGRLVVVGNLDTGEVSVNPSLFIVKELELLGAYATTQSELATAFALVADGKLRSDMTEVLPLSEAVRAHERLENREITGRLVLVPDQRAS